MNSRRSANLHDLTSLRLHPDGSRVKAEAEPKTSRKRDKSTAETGKNRSLRLAKYTTTDYLGNWIANDVSGSVHVKQKYNRKRPEDDHASRSYSDLENAQTEKIEYNSENRRTRKRRKFLEDLSFLDAPTSYHDTSSPISPGSGEAEGRNNDRGTSSSTGFSIPSSDLLKCIHLFASEYYTARGCLYNGSRKARMAKKVERQECYGGEEGSNNNNNGKPTRGSQILDASRLKKHKANSQRDMYRQFDGTALMAIGMLLQEHAAYYVSKGSGPEK
ncbi:hypothetical protein PNOK_0405900 [Pyrrhoderma noxium]|uniref:Uncharacterized protein n=1 Tax=Pyrrhoderma noxium TaxID=2282107 RepID=A0A286UPD0_9AGAM|nr:hypothetical protein PNOK_0405900 [Pyrrhoderma noxium]